jgi:hypothetical protein
MKKGIRLMVAVVAIMAFASATVSMAATEYYVAKDVHGKAAIVDKKPADATSIVKGPFPNKEDAEKAMKTGDTAKPAPLPSGK